MIVAILWKVFLSFLTITVVIGYIINGVYGDTNTFGEKYPKSVMVIGVIVMSTIVSFIAAVIGSIWTVF